MKPQLNILLKKRKYVVMLTFYFQIHKRASGRPDWLCFRFTLIRVRKSSKRRIEEEREKRRKLKGSKKQKTFANRNNMANLSAHFEIRKNETDVKCWQNISVKKKHLSKGANEFLLAFYSCSFVLVPKCSVSGQNQSQKKTSN